MSQNTDCAYCMKGELVARFGYEICELPASTVYLFKEQSHPGRCIVASKHHVSEMPELSEADQAAFLADIVKTANAIHRVFRPDKLNYGMYGDTGHHLHMHLVPKYRDGFEWGGTFAMDPKLRRLSEEECEALAAKLRPLLAE
ncbi:HIT family protein [Oribacterium sp. oral taxon 102]|uniref:HIT family protein n=1 Tax=Oribacterium sp. oral taxon 102 TaxID=671214 RepID=UPI0015BA22BC|nr:HIT family protein [Oribacterium sp. oral taxon 102]NWO20322.1 HIT family protein [Oribacterium sp. oral taxon 102]